MRLVNETHEVLDLGANASELESATFKVWAPHHQNLKIKIEGKGIFPLQRNIQGFFSTSLSGVGLGDRYFYVLDNGNERPDPVSRLLPQGVHGPTEIITNDFSWSDRDWKGIEWKKCIFYEAHVGTFTPTGTFEAIIEKLPYLRHLGITCLEIMPIAECPGRWNWGYDGASLYAVTKKYGGPEGFKKLIDACHAEGIAVCLDVVYNHMGPEGNYLADFGPYFTDHYHTPWGKAFNFDGPFSSPVRDFIIKNALYWILEYHVDALRCDAIHGIYDFSATPMLVELRREVQKIAHQTGRYIHLIAESDLNDSRVIRPFREGGWDFSAVWSEDFHHAAHVALTGEQESYYIDFKGIEDLAQAMQKGFVYEGQDSIFRNRHHGNSSLGIPYDKFIVFTQNHDQVGNRPTGDRLSIHLSLFQQKVAALLTVLTPSIPLLFMGQEYGERHPFEYFVDYEDKKLMEAIYKGRQQEFQREDMAFPGKEAFERSKLSWTTEGSELLDWYRTLLNIRKRYPPADLKTPEMTCIANQEASWIAWEYPTLEKKSLAIVCNLGKEPLALDFLNVNQPQTLLSHGTLQMRKKELVLDPLSAVVYLNLL